MPNKHTGTSNAVEAQPEVFIMANPSGGLLTADTQAEKATRALPALGEALAAPMAEFWQNLTQNGTLRPDEVEVKLGLNFEGGTSWAIVAKVGATVDITLKWTKWTKWTKGAEAATVK
jgi:hypothetical protein